MRDVPEALQNATGPYTDWACRIRIVENIIIQTFVVKSMPADELDDDFVVLKGHETQSTL